MAESTQLFNQSAVTSLDDTHRIPTAKTTGGIVNITWLSIKALIKTFIQGESLTLSKDLAMGTKKITGLGNGVNAQDAVTVSQLAGKANVNGGTPFDGKVTFDELGFNIPEFSGTFPTVNSDPQGAVGDIIRSGKRIALKTTADGWCYIDFIRL